MAPWGPSRALGRGFTGCYNRENGAVPGKMTDMKVIQLQHAWMVLPKQYNAGKIPIHVHQYYVAMQHDIFSI